VQLTGCLVGGAWGFRYLMASELTLEQLMIAARIVQAFYAHLDRQQPPLLPIGPSGRRVSLWDRTVSRHAPDADMRLFLLTDAHQLRAQAQRGGKVREAFCFAFVLRYVGSWS